MFTCLNSWSPPSVSAVPSSSDEILGLLVHTHFLPPTHAAAAAGATETDKATTRGLESNITNLPTARAWP